MPYVNVKITKDGVTAAQKKKLVQDITQSLVSTLGKKPDQIHIVIDEIELENWGFAGMLTSEFRTPAVPHEKKPFTVEYIAPRLLKSKPSRKDAMAHFISTLYRLQGGVTAAQVEQMISQLQKKNVLRIDAKGKVTYPDA